MSHSFGGVGADARASMAGTAARPTENGQYYQDNYQNEPDGLITECKPVTFDHRSVLGARADSSAWIRVVVEWRKSSRMLKGKA